VNFWFWIWKLDTFFFLLLLLLLLLLLWHEFCCLFFREKDFSLWGTVFLCQTVNI
jgi:hypothetical protein